MALKAGDERAARAHFILRSVHAKRMRMLTGAKPTSGGSPGLTSATFAAASHWGRMAKAVLFDVDGTLVDTNDLHASAWRETFLNFGIDISFDDVRAQIGKGGDNLLPTLLPTLDEDQRDELKDYRSNLFKGEYLARAIPFPGVRALFERVRSDDRRIILASSSEEEEVAFHLNLIGAADLVDGYTSRSDVESSKPDPDIFAAALRKSGVEAEEAVVVGDSPWDAKAACKLGLRTIALRCGGFPDAVLAEAGATEIHDSPQQLLVHYRESLIVH
jgi:HAD superfamily hydrolase (TIGR01509 family)